MKKRYSHVSSGKKKKVPLVTKGDSSRVLSVILVFYISSLSESMENLRKLCL